MSKALKIWKIMGERSIKRLRVVEGETKKAYSRKERRRGKGRKLRGDRLSYHDWEVTRCWLYNSEVSFTK